MWRLPQPSMACNDTRIHRPGKEYIIQMANTRRVTTDVELDKLLGDIAAVARSVGGLEFLVLNGHGHAGVMQMGKTPMHGTDAHKFDVLRGLIRQGIIFHSCSIAHTPTADEIRAYVPHTDPTDVVHYCPFPTPEDGKEFCRNIARYAMCTVWAAEEVQFNAVTDAPGDQKVPPGLIDYFEGPYYAFRPDSTGAVRMQTYTDPSHESIDEWNSMNDLFWSASVFQEVAPRVQAVNPWFEF